MKYDNTTKQMYYSDGINWVQIAATKPSEFVPKVVAAGKMTIQQTVPAGVFTDWNFTDIFVNDGNWNITNKVYTIPVTGFYQFSLTGGIKADADNNQSNWTIAINDHGNAYTRVTNTSSSISHLYFSYQGGTIVLYLTQGSEIRFGSVHCQGCTNNLNYLIDQGVFSISIIGT
jgi:hypothetical protein